MKSKSENLLRLWPPFALTLSVGLWIGTASAAVGGQLYEVLR